MAKIEESDSHLNSDELRLEEATRNPETQNPNVNPELETRNTEPYHFTMNTKRYFYEHISLLL